MRFLTHTGVGLGRWRLVLGALAIGGILWAWGVSGIAAGGAGAGAGVGGVDFGREVAPIFQSRCVSCHGAEKQEGGLRLDVRAWALRGGDSGKVIVAGDAAGSELIKRITSDDVKKRMPFEKAALSAEEVGRIRAWIDGGAAWPDALAGDAAVKSDHWSFQKPAAGAVPVFGDEAGRVWVRNPIDAFVLAELRRRGLGPSAEADRYTLIRRLYFDLLGLSPSVEEVDAFVGDQEEGAYERLVDRVLGRVGFGERFARHWMDVARYADTNGYEKDRPRSIWAWRDWVINAYNVNKPFDAFVIEQLAGDMIEGATADQRIATGFHRNTMINEEGGIDVEEFRYVSVVDRVRTTGMAFLGLTLECAQCHTHKYDPVTQREYWQFFAYLNNADEPEMDVPNEAIAARRAEIARKIAALEATRVEAAGGASAVAEKVGKWEGQVRGKCVDWRVARPVGMASQIATTFTVLDDGSVLVSGDNPNNNVYEVELVNEGDAVRAVRLEALADESLPDGGPGRAPLFSVGDFMLTDFRVEAWRDGQWKDVKVAGASHSYAQKGRDAALAIDEKSDTGWAVQGGIGKNHAAVFVLSEAVKGRGAKLRVRLEQQYIHQLTLGRFRLSLTGDEGAKASGLPADVEAIVVKGEAGRTEAEGARVRDYYLSIAPELKAIHKQIEAMEKGTPKFATTMVMREREAAHRRATRIHHRGEFTKPREAVDAGIPAIFGEIEGKSRLDLARWLVSRENPLTARVTVNRFWMRVFGRGLVETSGDFGTRGAKPTHPELLDWLAVRFMDRGWDVKWLMRLMVTSSVYRQDSKVSERMLEADPRNELLGRAPRYRVAGEVLRDMSLRASGLLTHQVGGKSVFPPQPAGVTSLSYGAITWKAAKGAQRYRRGVYTYMKRTTPYAGFTVFDAPIPDACVVERPRSNTPLGALTLLNDEVFTEAARALAERARHEVGDSVRGRIERMFRLCLTRAAREDELDLFEGFYKRQLEHTDENGAWLQVGRVLLNLDETVSRQ